ncbi:Macrophage migration inhibitory factor (MIF) [Eubacterium uniforme]|uniref:L-dopachrome isomerase n=1 Tax=Eubacterium uniforme TaxID=39495 RepID=A0A1T4VVX1_9FIRM|nr:phenylpyruvate tautomerase MIF-related protein [Eubacterium uniforme]SKA69106.1 Macrophage migration inhibitory factor (MIF) [Eubacterium uniforme]HAH18214.1 hypothetical protein [Eubacterium sp.]
MPFIDVKTNVAVSDDKKENIKSALGQAISLLPGKSENWLMVGINDNYDLWFKGDKSPAAMVEVKTYGVNAQGSENLTVEICNLLNNELGIATGRIYVSYFGTPNWGWDGRNF